VIPHISHVCLPTLALPRLGNLVETLVISSLSRIHHVFFHLQLSLLLCCTTNLRLYLIIFFTLATSLLHLCLVCFCASSSKQLLSSLVTASTLNQLWESTLSIYISSTVMYIVTSSLCNSTAARPISTIPFFFSYRLPHSAFYLHHSLSFSCRLPHLVFCLHNFPLSYAGCLTWCFVCIIFLFLMQAVSLDVFVCIFTQCFVYIFTFPQ
jgi:hypothetical protein